jgi:hypothetical protein
MAITFEKDIKPLFTRDDQEHMGPDGQSMFNLWNYDDVKDNATIILQVVKSGRMPPPEDKRPWTPQMIQKFNDWINSGYPK